MVDVPIMFQERLHGESKLSTKQTVEYVQQLLVLYRDAYKNLLMLAVLALDGLLYYVYSSGVVLEDRAGVFAP